MTVLLGYYVTLVGNIFKWARTPFLTSGSERIFFKLLLRNMAQKRFIEIQCSLSRASHSFSAGGNIYIPKFYADQTIL